MSTIPDWLDTEEDELTDADQVPHRPKKWDNTIELMTENYLSNCLS